MTEAQTPEQYFAARNFLLSFSAKDGFVWADLTRIETRQVLPQYGRGHDEASAAERAVARWRTEQGD